MSLKTFLSRSISVTAEGEKIVVANAHDDKPISDVRVMFGVPAGVAIEPIEFEVDTLAAGESVEAATISNVDPDATGERTETFTADCTCVVDGEEDKENYKVEATVGSSLPERDVEVDEIA